MSRIRPYIDEDAMDGDLVRVHSGIVLAQQKRYSTGEQIRRLIRVMSSFTREQMKNREEFLSGW